MWKTGIYTLKQMKEGHSSKTIFGAEKKYSITLYHQVQNLPNATNLMEKILFQFSDSRGAYKRTYQNRFEDFDQEVFSFLKKQFKKTEPLFVEDLAVSNGETACDFFEKLSTYFKHLFYRASDYDPYVYSIPTKYLTATFSSTGELLEILLKPFVINLIKRESIKLYPVNYLMHLVFKNLLKGHFKKMFFDKSAHKKRISLFSSKALSLEKQEKSFSLDQKNILEPFSQDRKNHVIRAMNVLNPEYFSNEEFRTVLCNIHHSLAESGILITGSNQDAGTQVDGGIFEKTPQGFRCLKVTGDGSPIDAIINNYQKS